MAEMLFVYGTLHPDRAPLEIADVVRRFRLVGPGSVRGHLYDLGEFPAMVLDTAGEPVTGDIFELPSDGVSLTRLDAYEEYVPESPGSSLFVREKTIVRLADASDAECWIYLYNRSLHGQRLQSQLAAVA